MNWARARAEARAPIRFHDIGSARATRSCGQRRPLLLWSLPLYTVVAMRRVFGRSWAGTLVKAFALFAVYMVVLSITLAGVFLYAVLQL